MTKALKPRQPWQVLTRKWLAAHPTMPINDISNETWRRKYGPFGPEYDAEWERKCDEHRAKPKRKRTSATNNVSE